MSTTVATGHSHAIDGHWYGRFPRDTSRGLELKIRVVEGGIVGQGCMGPLAIKPSSGAIIGSVGEGGSLAFDLQAHGPSGTTKTSFEAKFHGAELLVHVDGEEVRLTRTAGPLTFLSGWANTTFIAGPSTWQIDVVVQEHGPGSWKLVSGVPLEGNAISGPAELQGYILWPSWVAAVALATVESPGTSGQFNFEWQNTSNPAPLSPDHSWLVPYDYDHKVYAQSGSVSYGS